MNDMKKHLPMREIRMLAVLPLLLFTLAASARTQDGDPASVKNGRSFAERLMVELSVGAGTGCNGVKPLELSARIGYRFVPRVYAFVQSGALYGLYDSAESIYMRSQHDRVALASDVAYNSAFVESLGAKAHGCKLIYKVCLDFLCIACGAGNRNEIMELFHHVLFEIFLHIDTSELFEIAPL